jgi:hypothetical protein
VINLQPVLAHGAFNGSSADALVRVHAVAGGGVRERIFAEMMADGDCERIYDQTLAFRATDNLDRHRSRILAALPHSPLEAVSGVPQPLLVRAGHDATASALLVTNLSATRCRALLEFEGDASGARDESGAALAIASAGAPLTLELAPLQTRVVRAGGGVQLRGAGIEFPPGTEDALRHDLARLRQRRAALEMPMPLAVLDNPGFELPDHGGDVPGWQLLEPQRGKLHIVSGAPGGMGRGVAFDSDNGLATLRSNPFPAPATGRISIALWLRIDSDSPQPQLRIAIEGVQDDREYYRFAAVGHGPSARPLSAEWSQYVLQVDDLPTNRLESLRVRLDLVAGGSVQVDDVRVFDLAFDESQRVQLSKAMTLAEHRLANQDLGGCITALDSHWRRFLEAFVSEEAAMQAAQVAGMRHGAAAAADAESRPGADASAAGRPAGEVPRTGILDRVRRWWK